MKGCNEVSVQLSLCEKHYEEMRAQFQNSTDDTSNSRKRKERTGDERTAEALTKTQKSVSTGSSSVPLDKSGTKNDDNEKGMLLIHYSCIFI